jgi:hypothetical protein
MGTIRILLVCAATLAWASVSYANDVCEADYNGDGWVDSADAEIFQTVLGTQEGDANYLPAADHNGDGRVSALDYAHLLQCMEQ